MPEVFVPVRPEISVIAILAYAALAFVIGLGLTPWFIQFLRRNRLGKQLRVEAVDGRDASIFLKYHEKKFGTPTMGGLLIWGSILLTVLVSRLLSLGGVVESSLLQRGQVYWPLTMLVTMGILGAIDDYLNIVGENEEQWRRVLPRIRKIVLWSALALLLAVSAGFWFGARTMETAHYGSLLRFGLIGVPLLLALYLLAVVFLGAGSAFVDDALRRFVLTQGRKRGLGAFQKLSSLLLISGAAAAWFYVKGDYDSINVPFYGDLQIGLWYVPLFMLVIIGTANAVNVTDGLDGLAGGLLVISFGAFGALAYLQGLYPLAGFCAVVVGAAAAFLWHNVPPALFYMGDTGSLALGGTLGLIALMIDRVLVLPLVGFIFVVEMASVIIQLSSKRLRGGKKVFRSAPIHHHFEALEWGESKVTMRFWIVGAFAAVLGVIVGMLG